MSAQSLGWAAFLACSWTWCIGMFLPGILMRDYGLWGWVVFAAPNVIGAAAMGFVLRRSEQSRQIVQQHRVACVTFSLVTLAFHGFWLAWFAQRVVGLDGVLIALAGAVGVWGFSRTKSDRAMFIAVGAWLMSMALLLLALNTGTLPARVPTLSGYDAFLREGLLWIAPACIFGFLLCPYLDQTFHLAAQRTEGNHRRIAFGVGFGVMFLAMILYSLAYAGLQFAAFGSDASRILQLTRATGNHLILQAAFTIGVHSLILSHPINRDAVDGPTLHRGGMYAAVIAVAVGLGIGAAVNHLANNPAMIGERVYLSFLGCYGLAFPAYVWVCMMPHRWRDRSTPRSRLAVMLIILAVGTPLFWLGFVERYTFMVIPALLLALLVRPLIAVRSREPDERSQDET